MAENPSKTPGLPPLRPFGLDCLSGPGIEGARLGHAIARVIPELNADAMAWARLFDPELDLRLALEELVGAGNVQGTDPNTVSAQAAGVLLTAQRTESRTNLVLWFAADDTRADALMFALPLYGIDL